MKQSKYFLFKIKSDIFETEILNNTVVYSYSNFEAHGYQAQKPVSF